MKVLTILTASVAICLLAGCGEQAAAPVAPAAAPERAAVPEAPLEPVLPVVDVAAAQALLTDDETVEVVDFDVAGSRTVTGAVIGYKSTAYAVPVLAGQTLTVSLEPKDNTNLYINVLDVANTTGEAVHQGDLAGPKASFMAANDGVYLVRPYQFRAIARLGAESAYSILIERK
jgi:hypothetical protein